MTAVLDPPPAEPIRHVRPRRRQSPLSVLLGIIGEILITVGLLLGLYVVYQLWWTDIMGDHAQAEISEQFEATLPTSPNTAGEAQLGAPVAEELAPLTAETFARLWVPAWSSGDTFYVRPITEGTDRATVLDPLGIGHYEKTAMPGQIGNFAIAGHRQSHGKPFYSIDKLQEGDELIVETAENWYVYHVTSWDIVKPSDIEVIAPNPTDPTAAPDKAMITLTTCHPLFSTKERYIVHGELVEWMPRDAGRPASLVTGAPA
ncbi:sortase A [Salana multivorans]|uniref:Sortase A n=1 Tax=Salana multivorans TaxID=120377 RepID=A0A3N2DA66_9MICO|nr:class E sortase [Salana multivorans]ROR96689.1 sortase A [Salana multivorans]